MLIAEPCVAIHLAQLTKDFDRRYALCIQKLYYRPHFTSAGAGIRDSSFNRYNDSTVKTWKVSLVHIYTVTALGRGRVASPTLGRIYPRYSFYRILSIPKDQSRHDGVKKISTPTTPGVKRGPSSP